MLCCRDAMRSRDFAKKPISVFKSTFVKLLNAKYHRLRSTFPFRETLFLLFFFFRLKRDVYLSSTFFSEKILT